jgi:quercetin dioxygenase-like cupin family protein
MILRACALVTILVACLASSGSAQAGQGVVYQAPNGATTMRILLDETNVGPDVSVAEMTFAPNLDSGEHTHGAIEMFYVVSGELEHVVNGQSQILKPGMAGFVRPPDPVRHKTGAAGAKVVAIWVPGDEAGKIASRWRRLP